MKTYRGCKGSATVEMAYLMPLFFSVFVLVVYGVFYYHDKNILHGAAYETAVMGTQLLRMEEKEPEVLETYIRQRIRGKLLLFQGISQEIRITKEEVIVQVQTAKGKMKIRVEEKASRIEPEKEIRKIKHGKEIITGGKRP
ncbi:MAG: pilus assembly protein [Lachnospiraceae bacterium]